MCVGGLRCWCDVRQQECWCSGIHRQHSAIGWLSAVDMGGCSCARWCQSCGAHTLCCYRCCPLQAADGDGSAGLLHQVKELQLANTELQQQLHQQSRTSGARPLLTARSSAGGAMAAAAASAAASNNMALVQQLQEQQQAADQAIEQKSE